MIKVNVNAKQNPNSIIESHIFSVYRGSTIQAQLHWPCNTHRGVSTFHRIPMHQEMLGA